MKIVIFLMSVWLATAQNIDRRVGDARDQRQSSHHYVNPPEHVTPHISLADIDKTMIKKAGVATHQQPPRFDSPPPPYQPHPIYDHGYPRLQPPSYSIPQYGGYQAYPNLPPPYGGYPGPIPPNIGYPGPQNGPEPQLYDVAEVHPPHDHYNMPHVVNNKYRNPQSINNNPNPQLPYNAYSNSYPDPYPLGPQYLPNPYVNQMYPNTYNTNYGSMLPVQQQYVNNHAYDSHPIFNSTDPYRGADQNPNLYYPNHYPINNGYPQPYPGNPIYQVPPNPYYGPGPNNIPPPYVLNRPLPRIDPHLHVPISNNNNFPSNNNDPRLTPPQNNPKYINPNPISESPLQKPVTTPTSVTQEPSTKPSPDKDSIQDETRITTANQPPSEDCSSPEPNEASKPENTLIDSSSSVSETESTKTLSESSSYSESNHKIPVGDELPPSKEDTNVNEEPVIINESPLPTKSSSENVLDTSSSQNQFDDKQTADYSKSSTFRQDKSKSTKNESIQSHSNTSEDMQTTTSPGIIVGDVHPCPHNPDAWCVLKKVKRRRKRIKSPNDATAEATTLPSEDYQQNTQVDYEETTETTVVYD